MNGTVTAILIGRSGCGKGTQAKLLKKHLEEATGREVICVSTGDKMREAMRLGNETSRLIDEKIMKAGVLAPYGLAVWAWFDAFIKQNLGPEKHLILDGTPRSAAEAEMLTEALEWYGRAPICPILIDTSEAEVARRMLARGRADDTEENIKNRLLYYSAEVAPVITILRVYTQLMGKIFLRVLADSKSPEAVHVEILAHLRKHFSF